MTKMMQFGEWCANGALSGLSLKKRIARYNPDSRARQQHSLLRRDFAYKKIGWFWEYGPVAEGVKAPPACRHGVWGG